MPKENVIRLYQGCIQRDTFLIKSASHEYYGSYQQILSNSAIDRFRDILYFLYSKLMLHDRTAHCIINYSLASRPTITIGLFYNTEQFDQFSIILLPKILQTKDAIRVITFYIYTNEQVKLSLKKKLKLLNCYLILEIVNRQTNKTIKNKYF